MDQKWIGRSAFAVSVALHAWLMMKAPEVAAKKETPPPLAVELHHQAPAPEPEIVPAPEPEPEPPAQPREAPDPEIEVHAEPEPEAAADSESKEPPEPVEELTGTTLTAEGEGLFQAEVGSGRARRGAIRAGSSEPAIQSHKVVKRSAPSPQKPEPTDAVPLALLSKKPIPPDLGGALERNYPADARRQGKAGEAKVRARVEATGSIRFAKVAFESEGGFGDACRKTLLSSKWTAPLDREGNPVATWVSYSCKFRAH